MNLSMSSATLSASFINSCYDFLIISLLNLAQKQSYSAIFPCCDVNSGRHSNAPPRTVFMEKQVALYKQTNCNILKLLEVYSIR